MADENYITINGERRGFEGSRSLRELVLSLDLDPEKIAVELNRNIVKRPLWDSTPVEAGAQLEIVQFVGGG